MLKKLDSILMNIIRFLERLHVRLGQAGDYVLDIISRTFQAVLQVIRHAISTIYRFLHDLVINLLKIMWHLIQLSLVPLFFAFIWGFGYELRHISVRWLGLCLEVIGIAGFALFLIALLASLAKSSKEEESPASKRGHIQITFFFMNLLALVIVLVATFAWAHWFTNPLLRISQIGMCRLFVRLAVALDANEQASARSIVRAAADATGPAPLRAGTNIGWPTLNKSVDPQIPSQAMRKDAFGTVGLEVLLSSDGHIRLITITQSVPFIDEAVMSAVRQWEYQPTIIDGTAVPVIVPVLYRWAGIPIPQEVLLQLTGRGTFESSEILTGTLLNPTSWIVGAERHVFRGPKNEKLPMIWERYCDIYVAIEPGTSKEFRCEVEAVDLSQGWRWEMVAAWGLPPIK